MTSGYVIAIGASSGALAALKIVLRALPHGYPHAVIAVTHARPHQIQMAELLAPSSAIPVVEAQSRAAVAPGAVHLAPPGYHLLVERDLRFALSVDEKVAYSRPSIDVLFESLADACGNRAIGVILTGANEDGARGLAAIRAAGGIALVQDPREARAPQMPEAALRIAGADFTLRLRELGLQLAALDRQR
jgi:two-component system chemotaxis response regulator CheB